MTISDSRKKQEESTMPFKLQPTDILVDVNESTAIKSVIERWALGNPYTHVRMYFGHGEATMNPPITPMFRFIHPMFYESVGRGVIFTDVRDSFGRKVEVMRLSEDIIDYPVLVDRVLNSAWKIATDDQSKYDYMCIPNYIVIRLICEKLHIPLPLKYHRNPYMICSEAVAEVFWRSGIDVLPQSVLPLPGDFVLKSRFLVNEGQHLISADMF